MNAAREAVPVTYDRTLTLTYDEDVGQVVLEGLPCGPAGEAGLSLADGIELFFDCADGRLSKVFIEAGKPALAAVTGLFGARARAAVQRAPSSNGNPLTVVAEPQLMAALSRLARLDAVRFTSPVAESPLWAVEAAHLARQAGLATRVDAEARRDGAAGGHLSGRRDPRRTVRLGQGSRRAPPADRGAFPRRAVSHPAVLSSTCAY